MELGLSLGDASNTVEFSKETKSADQDKKPTKMSGLDFCMALGLSRSSEDDCDREHLQLNLLPDNPVRQIKPHLQSLPWSSDNGGSSENGSSAAARVLDVNRLPAEEVSSTNSVGSPLIHIDIGMYRDSTRGIDGDYSCNNRSLSTDFEAANGNNDDDDEENGINARKKLRLSKQQSAFLEESFKEQSTLNPKQKLALAKQLNLRPRQVEVWFQNRRARTKLKKTEVDCEYLKRCCETLTEENRRLQKELQELRVLKTTNPFYMQLPATTLTMCPSCEKVATMTDTIPFPLTRPRFYPFTRAPTHSNN